MVEVYVMNFDHPYIQEQNSRLEREMQTNVESARTMLINSEVYA